MANLRLVQLRVNNSRTIRSSWTEDLDPNIGTDNVIIRSINPGVGDSLVQTVSITKRFLTITCLPLIPFARYEVVFRSTLAQPFQSKNHRSHLLEDAKTNVAPILGAENPVNAARNNILFLLAKNIYDLQQGTFVRTVLDRIGGGIQGANNDIGQLRNSTFLDAPVIDERKVRGYGPYDKLSEGSAYDIIRVGQTETNTTLSGSISLASFPFDPISLQARTVINEGLEAGTGAGTFDRFILTVNKGPVIIVESIRITYADTTTFDYPINSLGYRLQNSRYDSPHASTFLGLEPNQIELNDDVIDLPGFKIPAVGDFIRITYQFKALGRYVEAESVVVSRVLVQLRESTPALINQFSLQHAPIVNNKDEIPQTGGVQFLDPESDTPFQTVHPAFITEIPFVFENIPRNPGEYSVDYATGRVFVFGANKEQEGTGFFPPAATYKYRKVFQNDLDYIYNPEEQEIVQSPLRDLATQPVKITFNYEEALIPYTDFIPQVHQEVLDERMENRLVASNALQVTNSPVTNVFRIFNETSGEIYSVTRFEGDTIFYSFDFPPAVGEENRERASFKFFNGETLILSKEFLNAKGVRVFKVPLQSFPVISATQDLIGSSFNSSATFSRNDLFELELYYDDFLSETFNVNRLEIGFYSINYEEGLVYVGVASSQIADVGTITYAGPIIVPNNPHVTGVADIFFSLSPNLLPSKRFNYSGFQEAEIFPLGLDFSNERFFNGDPTQPYFVNAGTIEVTYDIRAIQGIYDGYDLDNNLIPTNFAPGATFLGTLITLDPTGIQKQTNGLVVQPGLEVTVPTIAPGINLNLALSVIRVSDGAELLDGYETIIGNTINLNIGTVGDVVNVVYTVELNGAATPIVDYDHGGLYINYSYVADEILISYEHGNNQLDFSQSSTLDPGDVYYVSYKIGALRDALFNNFGSLVAIPDFESFDTDFSRESYRDALIGALQSFTKGPTIPALKELVSAVTKISPRITEAIFEVWSLGVSFLQPVEPQVLGEPILTPGKFDQGILCTKVGQAVSFPVSSNLRLDEGTMQMWVVPQWDGLDNDAELLFCDLKLDGYLLPANKIFIGAASTNPIYDAQNKFKVNRNSDDCIPGGVPSKLFTEPKGMFIYFDEDISRWNMIVKDGYVAPPDGYVYSGKITATGEFYDVKYLPNMGEGTDRLQSAEGNIEFRLTVDNDGYCFNGPVDGYSCDGITFMADEFHYFFDFAETATTNRMSLYKDGSGYLNFEVWDRGGRIPNRPTRKNRYSVSADIQSWRKGEKHNIATAWQVNTSDNRDVLHLFIDGFEVPNILRYGGRPIATSSDRFRTVQPEVVAGTLPVPIVGGHDLVTIAGQPFVSSPTIDFEDRGVTGGFIRIFESGFGDFLINSVAGNVITLSSPMPASLLDARFSVNPFTAVVSDQVGIAPNVEVSMLSGGEEVEIPGVRAENPAYEIGKNAFNETTLTILNDGYTGDQILIRTLGLNNRRCKEPVFIWGNTQSILKTNLPPPINVQETLITKIIVPLVPIGPANSIIVGPNYDGYVDGYFQPSNVVEGRKLAVRITGDNIDFTTPTTVTISGATTGGPLSETLVFTQVETLPTVARFTQIDEVNVVTRPVTFLRDGTAVEITELFPITVADTNAIYPVIRYALKTGQGDTLQGDGSDIVTDPDGDFALSDVGNLIKLTLPLIVSGVYEIVERISNTEVRLSPAPPVAFVGGDYEIYQITPSTNGFQNGFFFLLEAGTANTPFELTEGFYEFNYSAYLEIPFDPLCQQAFIGNNFLGDKPAKAIIDEFRILSRQLTDTRVGEDLDAGQESITTGYTAIRPFIKNPQTLVLIHFDTLPLDNDSDFYVFANKDFIQSANSVNERFEQSIVIKEKGLEFQNEGRLDTRNSGTIEFWISPRFDTLNDPNLRFYFDAAAAVTEDTVSDTKTQLKVSNRIFEIIEIREIGNPNSPNFADGALVSDDRTTINLSKALPGSKTPVTVTFVPSGFVGDRVSIFKDVNGEIVFNARAKGQDYQLRRQVLWARDTWHRVMATYKFNSLNNKDELRLFLDGEEWGEIRFGEGLIYGTGYVYGEAAVGIGTTLIADINFTDTLFQFSIGQDYRGFFPAQARMDNLKISNLAQNPRIILGQPFDVNYNSNLSMVYPVIEDAFTTFLLNFNSLLAKNEDFAILRDAAFGVFNFDIDIIDSFDIVLDNERLKKLLESAILALKPATAKVGIKYFQ